MPTALRDLIDIISQLEMEISVLREETRMTDPMMAPSIQQHLQQAGPITNQQQQRPPIMKQGMVQEMQQHAYASLPQMNGQEVPVYYASNDYVRPPPPKDKQLFDPKKPSVMKDTKKDNIDLENSLANMMDRLQTSVVQAVNAVAERSMPDPTTT